METGASCHPDCDVREHEPHEILKEGGQGQTECIATKNDTPDFKKEIHIALLARRCH